jgi:hypothetical protein
MKAKDGSKDESANRPDVVVGPPHAKSLAEDLKN